MQQCEKHGNVALVQDGTERCAMCEMHGIVATTQRSVEGALVNSRGSFSIESVSNLTGMLELGGSVTYFSVNELQCNS